MKSIAVIGTGIMGNGIATNYLKQGYKVTVWNRSKNKLQKLKKLGAEIANSPKAATQKADIIFEVTANDKSSKQVWLSENGIIAGASKEKILITNATLSIKWLDELAQKCKQMKLNFFDMPMTGGRIGAETGKLVFLVGGSQKQLKPIEKDLQAVSEQIIYFDKPGAGMRYKLILNMMQGIHIIAFGEALKLAKEMELDIKKVGSALAERPGGTATNIAWRDYQVKPNPINFSIEWITKDLTYAKKSATKTKTPLLDKTLGAYKQALKQGRGQEDWTAVNK